MKHWTTKELAVLREMHSLGFSALRIAEALARSRGSVTAQLALLGINSTSSKEIFAGESAVRLEVSVASSTYYRFHHMCKEYGSHPGIFLDSLLNNFMDSIDYQPEENENAEAAE